LSFQGRPEDIRDWDAWECSFYGKVPSLSGESEGSFVLPMDVKLDGIKWNCPELLGEWALECWIDDELIFEIDPVSAPEGVVEIQDNDVLIVLKGSSIVTKLYYRGESDDYPQYERDLGRQTGYSIFVSGFSFRQEKPNTLREYLLELPPEMKSHETWQDENA